MKKTVYNQIVTIIVLTALPTAFVHAQSVRDMRSLQLSEHAGEQQKSFDAMQKRLDALANLKSSNNPWDVYNLAKAQAWLDFAFDSRTQRDASNVVAEAFNQGDKLTTQLEAKSPNISLDTPIIPTSTRLRDDIWKIADDMKRHANFGCAAAKVAQFEVQLVQGGHAYQQLGWHHSKPYFQAAERLSKDAQGLIANGCVVKPVAPVIAPPVIVAQPTPAPTPAPPPVIVVEPQPVASVVVQAPPTVTPVFQPVPAPAVRELRTLADRVHFAYKSAAIAPTTANLLDEAASIMHQHPQARLTLQGHTDKRGSQRYNLNLAKQRAQSAKEYLVNAGVEAQRMDVVAYGKAKPAKLTGRKGQAYNRRVEFMVMHNDINLQKQFADLQPRKSALKHKLKSKPGKQQ